MISTAKPSRGARLNLTSLLNAGVVASILYLAASALRAVLNGVYYGSSFSGYGADGPFQLYNPLRRLAAGEMVGADFQFFHGPGVLLIHYPLFALFGENLFASELSRWVVSPVLFYGSGIVFFLALLKRWKLATIAVVLYGAIMLPIDRMIDPSNSLLGVRSTLPIMVAAALVWTPRREWQLGFIRVSIPLVLAVLSAGAAVSFGTEQGVACCIAFIIVRAVNALLQFRSVWRAACRTAVESVALAVSVVACSAALTAGNPFAALKYALVDIPQDQGWVFGSPPNTPLTWEALGAQLTDVNGQPPVPLYFVLLGTAIALLSVAIRLKLIDVSSMQAQAMMVLYGFGVGASAIGYVYLADQLAPLAKMAALIAAGAATAIVFRGLHNVGPQVAPILTVRPRRPVTLSIAGLAVVAIFAVVVGGVSQARSIADMPLRALIHAARIGPGSSDTQLLGVGWAASLASFKPFMGSGQSIWSVYSGIYESTSGAFSPAPGGEDYMIHAVGKDRREAYQRAFIKQSPDLVVTMNPAYFGYEEWIWSKDPLFYEYLLSNYDLIASNASHNLWRRSSVAPASPTANVPADVTDSKIRLPPNATGDVQLWVVSVDYHAHTDLAILDRLPRYLLNPSDTGLGLSVSLPWYQSSWQFVVPVMPGQGSPELAVQTVGIVPSAALDITSAKIRPLVPASARNLGLFGQTYCLWKTTPIDRTACHVP